ncbi:MAG TPA: hypothetical protein VH520_00035 [Streptosporangiaceae bacterium]
MGDTRACENCGEPFVPRREHGRFCSSRCRVAWNRGTMHYPPGEASALDWSISAMVETIDRLPRVKAWDGARAMAVIGEAVWWVTIVDATMVRYHPDTYDQILAGASAADRLTIEESLAGLRYVRNHMGHDIDHVDFVKGAPRQPGRAADRIANWAWRPLPEPCVTALSPSAREWEMDRYRAYQERLAHHAVGEAFSRARVFLADVATTAEPDKLGVWAN